jgi:hypothetical protein
MKASMSMEWKRRKECGLGEGMGSGVMLSLVKTGKWSEGDKD